MLNIQHVIDKHKLFFCNVDYSSYDLTLSPELLIVGLMIIKDIMRLTSDQELILDYIFRHIIETPFFILNPSTGIIESFIKTLGLPSGSQWTNLLGSILDLLIRTYTLMKMYGVKFVVEMDRRFLEKKAPPVMVMGDDLAT